MIIIVLLVIIFVIVAFARQEKTVAGYITDCKTNRPITNANVSVRQRGWGFSDSDGSLVWDKDYITTTQSDASGHFSLSYSVGSSAHLWVEKNGYITAEQWESPRQDIQIKMLQGFKPTRTTEDCKLRE